MKIRVETVADRAAVRAVNEAAFETSDEANIVDCLRRDASPVISLVAEEAEVVVGHIFFSPVTISDRPDLDIMGLAPMAVMPDQQCKGVGSALVRAGLVECRQLGAGAVVVLGHAAYYPRFGFLPAARFGLTCDYDVPEDVFMVVELTPDYLHDAYGTVRFHPAFSGE